MSATGRWKRTNGSGRRSGDRSQEPECGACPAIPALSVSVDYFGGEDEEQRLVVADAETADDHFLALFDVNIGVETEVDDHTTRGRPAQVILQTVEPHRRAVRRYGGRVH